MALDGIREELYEGFVQAYRTLVPEQKDRIPMSPEAAAFALITALPILFMAYLARRPDTYLTRLLLLPLTIMGLVSSAYRYYCVTPILNVYNWAVSLHAAVAIAKALQYALTPEGILKRDEIAPGVKAPPPKLNGKANGKAPHQNGDAHGPDEAEKHNAAADAGPGGDDSEQLPPPNVPSGPSWAPAWLHDAVELLITMRGLKYKFGHGVHIPHETRPLERGPFLRATLRLFITKFLIVDFLETCIKLFPGVGSPFGGSMIYPELPTAQRLLVALAIHAMTGTAIVIGFEMVYYLITLIAVGLLHSDPIYWPPVLDGPHLAESMHQLWSTSWHQMLRNTFVTYGGIPGLVLGREIGRFIGGEKGAKVVGNSLAVVGTFLASGLFHEVSMSAMGRGWDNAPIIFFAMQAPILFLERAWRVVTGKRVGGWPGRLWVYFVMFVLAQPMVNSWHRRGLGGGLVIPYFVSPTKIAFHFLGVRGFDFSRTTP
ncbi:hypothetical protein K525DRAFT_223306 [Schizophyllum commune Loenen D]|nr:hypothetical protein K525DRAFT_223306 [Schizophyllum commune Loenen D]